MQFPLWFGSFFRKGIYKHEEVYQRYFAVSYTVWNRPVDQKCGNYLKGQETKKVLGDFFVLRYLKNYGAAFGILQNKQIFLILLTAVILVMILYVYIKTPDTPHYRLIRIFSIMLAAGAMGNMYDRFAHRYVIDFLYAKVIDFPIFNVADCYVVVSAVVLAMLIGFYYQEEDMAVYKFGGKKEKESSSL